MREAIRQALEQYFSDSWKVSPGGAPRTAIAWMNTTHEPVATLPWVRFSIIEAGAGRAFMGKDEEWGRRTFGRVVVQVFVPARSGLGAANVLAGHVSALFDEQRVLFSGGSFSGTITLGVATVRAIPPREGATWQQVNVEAPYDTVVEQVTA